MILASWRLLLSLTDGGAPVGGEAGERPDREEDGELLHWEEGVLGFSGVHETTQNTREVSGGSHILLLRRHHDLGKIWEGGDQTFLIFRSHPKTLRNQVTKNRKVLVE